MKPAFVLIIVNTDIAIRLFMISPYGFICIFHNKISPYDLIYTYTV